MRCRSESLKEFEEIEEDGWEKEDGEEDEDEDEGTNRETRARNRTRTKMKTSTRTINRMCISNQLSN